MTWTRIPDDFNERDELLECSRSARLLHVELLVYGNRRENDGRIPYRRLSRFSDSSDLDADLDELVANGLATVEDDIIVVDWSDQENAEDVRERREYRAQVQKAYRKRRDAHRRGDHSLCDSRFCKQAVVTGNQTSNKSGHETPFRSGPSRQGQGQEQSAAAGSAGATPVALQQHEFRPDETGVDCLECNLPANNNRVHLRPAS